MQSFSDILRLADAGAKTPLYLVRAGNDQIPTLRDSIDRFAAEALKTDYPLTLANHPANVFLVIIDNGIYEVTGGQATAGSGHTDFAALARAAGIQRVYAFDTAERWRSSAQEALTGPGPVIIVLNVEVAVHVSNVRRKFFIRFDCQGFINRDEFQFTQRCGKN